MAYPILRPVLETLQGGTFSFLYPVGSNMLDTDEEEKWAFLWWISTDLLVLQRKIN